MVLTWKPETNPQAKLRTTDENTDTHTHTDTQTHTHTNTGTDLHDLGFGHRS